MFTLALGLVILALLIASNWRRDQLAGRIQLIPNCLITRAPLVFVTGRRSPFYFLNYWRHIPRFLREHGYEVIELELPWRASTARQNELRRFLDAGHANGHTFHFFLDQTAAQDALWLKTLNHPAIRTVTMTPPAYLRHPWTWRDLIERIAVHAHRFYVPASSPSPRTQDLPVEPLRNDKDFLKFAVSLAEKDLIWSHTE